MIRDIAVKPLLDRCEAYCATKGMSAARLSTLIFNSGTRLDSIKAGGNVTVATLQDASDALAVLERGEKLERKPKAALAA